MHNPALAHLRDIHLPAPIVWFPPAPGWFVLTIIVIAVMLLLLFWLNKWRQKKRRQQRVMQTFEHLQQAYHTDPNNAAFAQLNQLLKQVAMTLYPGRSSETLIGEAWLAFLNETGHTTDFTAIYGKQLIEATYSQHKVAQPEAIFSLCEHWLRKQL